MIKQKHNHLFIEKTIISLVCGEPFSSIPWKEHYNDFTNLNRANKENGHKVIIVILSIHCAEILGKYSFY